MLQNAKIAGDCQNSYRLWRHLNKLLFCSALICFATGKRLIKVWRVILLISHVTCDETCEIWWDLWSIYCVHNWSVFNASNASTTLGLWGGSITPGSRGLAAPGKVWSGHSRDNKQPTSLPSHTHIEHTALTQCSAVQSASDCSAVPPQLQKSWVELWRWWGMFGCNAQLWVTWSGWE